MDQPKTVIVLKQVYHREHYCIAILFPKDFDLIRIVRTISGATFSNTMSCWYVANRWGLVDEIVTAYEGVASVDRSAFRKSNTLLRETMRDVKSAEINMHALETRTKEGPRSEAKPMPDLQTSPATSEDDSKGRNGKGELEMRMMLRMMEQKLLLKGYSANTLKTYLQQFKEFLLFFGNVATIDLTEIDIRNYLLYLVEKKRVSKSYQNQAINAIKFFYEKIMMQERKVYYLERPMREKRLPKVLSQENLMAIFGALENIKHRVMLMLIYAAGLRRSELLALTVSDVDPERHVVFIRGGKGKKDRQSIMAQSLTPLLRQYMEEYRPSFWLFEGRGGERYTESSLQQVLKQAVRKAGINKHVTLHMLRHSFATHLLESGTSTRYIQELLGHESPVTTEIYARVTRFGLDKIKSPLDHIASAKHLRGDDGGDNCTK